MRPGREILQQQRSDPSAPVCVGHEDGELAAVIRAVAAFAGGDAHQGVALRGEDGEVLVGLGLAQPVDLRGEDVAAGPGEET